MLLAPFCGASGELGFDPIEPVLDGAGRPPTIPTILLTTKACSRADLSMLICPILVSLLTSTFCNSPRKPGPRLT